VPIIVPLTKTQTYILSPKVRSVLYNLKLLKGKQYVYVKTFKQAQLLAQAYALMLQQTTKSLDATIDMAVSGATIFASKKPRYIILGNKPPPGISEKGFKDGLRAVFDDEKNNHGEFIKLLIAWGPKYEGVDVKALRVVHCVVELDPLKQRQLEGRGIRYCGHAGLPYRDRSVVVARYALVCSSSVSSLKRLFDMAMNVCYGRSGSLSSRPGRGRRGGMRGGGAQQRLFQALRNVLPVLVSSKGSDMWARDMFRKDPETLSLAHFEKCMIAMSIDCTAFNKPQLYGPGYRGVQCGMLPNIDSNVVIDVIPGRVCRQKQR
jgi:hypothetical protein